MPEIKYEASEEIRDLFESDTDDYMDDYEVSEDTPDRIEETIDRKTDDGLFLLQTEAICMQIPGGQSEEHPVKKANQEAVNRRLPRLLNIVKANYEKPDPEAAAEVRGILEDADIPGNQNPDYASMQMLMQGIEEICAKGITSELTEGEQQELSDQLDALEGAAKSYLRAKYASDDAFTKNALKRIDAARVCSSFAHGRKCSLLIEKEKKQKEQQNMEVAIGLARRVQTYGQVSTARVKKLRKTAEEEFIAHPGAETYAKFRALQSVTSLMKKGHKIKEEDVENYIRGKEEAYKILAEMDSTFAQILKEGKVEVIRDFEKIMGDRLKQFDEIRKREEAEKQKKLEEEKQEKEQRKKAKAGKEETPKKKEPESPQITAKP